jgi:ABC-type transport system involved in cytochrome c biogenesis permease subunit
MIALHTWCSLLSYAAFLAAFVTGALFLILERQLKRKRMGMLFHRLPSLGALDRLNFLAISVGFGLLTIGATSGFVQAALVRGDWWTGDPKEYLTVSLWAGYLALWALRRRAVLRGHRVALLSVAGFTLVLLTFLGAGRLVPSLHPFIHA